METGTNILYLALYTRADLVDARLGTDELEVDDATPALSYDYHRMGIEIPLGEERTVSVDVAGNVAAGRYDLLLASQPMAVIGDYDVTVRPTPGWTVVGQDVNADGSYTVSGLLDFHQAISVEFAPVT